MVDRRREKILIRETLQRFYEKVKIENIKKKWLKKGYWLEWDEDGYCYLYTERIETDKEFEERCILIDFYEKMEEEREHGQYLRLKQKYDPN